MGIYIVTRFIGSDYFGYAFIQNELTTTLDDGEYLHLDDSVYWFHFEICCVDFFGDFYMNAYNI